MTPIGHTLTGLAIGYAVLPSPFSPRAKAVTLGMFAILANSPDLPLPGWGHDRYNISHSIFVTMVASLLAVALAASLLRRTSYFSWPLFLGGAVAWCSHIFLDTMYNHGRGLLIGWPFGKGRVAFPVPWFSTMNRSPLFSEHNFTVWTTEALFYGAIFATVVIVRHLLNRKFLTK